MIMTGEIKSYINFFVKDIVKWDKEMKHLGLIVKKQEDIVQEKKNALNVLEHYLLSLQRDIECLYEKSPHGIQETLNEILNEPSAAALWLAFKMRFPESRQLPLIKQVLGVVALLGKVEDDLVNMALCDFLGKENLLALVCETREGVDALEKFDENGELMTVAIHGLASAQNIKLDGRFRVICLDDIEHFDGGLKDDDPQRRLIIEDPTSSTGETPEGYIGYAVNLIIMDPDNGCSPGTTSVGRLRKTLFFHLFRYLQVYETRYHMYKASPYIKDGAVSLDGGIIRQRGVLECGNRVCVHLRFPIVPRVKPTNFRLKLKMEEWLKQKYEDRKVLQGNIEEEVVTLQTVKTKFAEKLRELDEREAQNKLILEKFQQKHLYSKDQKGSK